MSLVNKVLHKLWFSKNWNNKADFPTYEMREDQVRADIQLLHDETQTAFNNLVDDLESLSAENIPFESSTAVPASNLQEAVDNVQQQVAEASAATIPNASITDEKLAPGVPSNKADLVGGIVKADQMRLRVVDVEGANLTLSGADIGKLLVCRSHFSPDDVWSVTIPSDSSDIPVGSEIEFFRLGSSAALQISFIASETWVYDGADGAQFISPIRFSSAGCFIRLIKIRSDEWLLVRTD